MQTLYKKDSKGKIRQWDVSVTDSTITVSSGLLDGKKTSQVTTCKGKNIGKTNETSPEEQALLEAKAKWTKQVEREDYHWDVDLSGNQLRPQLALDYTKVGHRVRWENVVGQPKLDGLRLCVGSRDTRLGYDSDNIEMLTRKGETYNVEHLVDPCKKLLAYINENLVEDNKCLALDGEIYKHGLPLQKIVSGAKKYRKGLTESLEFHIFDLVIEGMGFAERYDILVEAIHTSGLDLGGVTIIGTIPSLDNPEDAKKAVGHCMAEGYEGLMLRHLDGKYTIGKRSPDLFKYKEFQDKECKIVDVWWDRNNNALFTCLFDHNNVESSFNCTPKRSHEERKLMQKEAYIGKWLTVKYQDLTEDGLPTFPVGLDLRDCDDDGNPLN